MATYNAINYTKQFVNVPSEKIPKGEQYGVMRVAYDKYSLAADLSAGDYINMMKLPAGARLIDATIKLGALGAGSLDVGWEGDDDGVAHDAGSGRLNNEAGLMKVFSAETLIRVKVAVDTSATSGDIELSLIYVVD